MLRVLWVWLLTTTSLLAAEPTRFDKHGRIRVAKAGAHLEHSDGTPFFFLADTCWTGPALSKTAADWDRYLADRVSKKFTAVQFNIASPWRTAPTDADGNVSYRVEGGELKIQEAFYRRLDDRIAAINKAGLLAVPVLGWAHRAGDTLDLSDEHFLQLVKYEVERYSKYHVLWILAGDNSYNPKQTERIKTIGRAVFGDKNTIPVTTHPTGMNWPWNSWHDETWLTVLGYQSGHGDDANTLKWIHSGPVAAYKQSPKLTRPIINLEPPYEAHNGYQSKKPHTDYTVRRAMYWSLFNAPTAGVTYGGHGVWSWHTKPGEHPTGHQGTGPAVSWDDALNLPGAGQMKHLATLMESLPWHQLRPSQNLLREQPGATDPAKFIACAATPNDNVIVIYAPVGGTIPLNLGNLSGVRSKDWFDPRTGKRRPCDDSFTAPDSSDWLLVIRR